MDMAADDTSSRSFARHTRTRTVLDVHTNWIIQSTRLFMFIAVYQTKPRKPHTELQHQPTPPRPASTPISHLPTQQLPFSASGRHPFAPRASHYRPVKHKSIWERGEREHIAAPTKGVSPRLTPTPPRHGTTTARPIIARNITSYYSQEHHIYNHPSLITRRS
jgi:hypothetical protein